MNISLKYFVLISIPAVIDIFLTLYSAKYRKEKFSLKEYNNLSRDRKINPEGYRKLLPIYFMVKRSKRKKWLTCQLIGPILYLMVIGFLVWDLLYNSASFIESVF